MPDIALLAQIAYLAGGIFCLVMVARSPLPAALFWGAGAVLHTALAAAELADRLGLSAFAGLEGDLRYLAFTAGMFGLAFGAVFSLILPPGSQRQTLITGIALALLIAIAADRLPLGRLPVPLILLGVFMIAIVVGLRHRPVPGRWLLLGTLALALAELGRYGYLGFVPVSPSNVARFCFGAALAAFGLTAYRAR